jgi:hypothetical protein
VKPSGEGLSMCLLLSCSKLGHSLANFMDCFLDLHIQHKICYSFVFGNIFFVTSLIKNQLSNLLIKRLSVDMPLVQDIKNFVSQLGAYTL